MRDVFVIGLGQGAVVDKFFEENTSEPSVTLAKVTKIAMESSLREYHNSKYSWQIMIAVPTPIPVARGYFKARREDVRIQR